MATIQEELNYLEETKGLIKNAIINKGQDITDQDSFRSYVNKIDNISTINLQSKTIDPTTNQQIIIPDQPNYNGLSSVTINAVTSNIDNNITVENIRSGVSILGVTGNYSGIDTSDATALVNDIEEGKTAYVNGVKLTGTIKNTSYKNEFEANAVAMDGGYNHSTVLTYELIPTNDIVIRSTNDACYVYATEDDVATAIGLTADVIKQGETILNVTGNYSGGIKEYANTTTMNNDISNISIDEVVKVLSGPNYFIKELVSNIPTMTELVKESETISPQEYEENIELVNDILGEEE